MTKWYQLQAWTDIADWQWSIELNGRRKNCQSIMNWSPWCALAAAPTVWKWTQKLGSGARIWMRVGLWDWKPDWILSEQSCSRMKLTRVEVDDRITWGANVVSNDLRVWRHRLHICHEIVGHRLRRMFYTPWVCPSADRFGNLDAWLSRRVSALCRHCCLKRRHVLSRSKVEESCGVTSVQL